MNIKSEKMKDYYFYKNKGICTSCHKNDVYKNKILCLECLLKRRERDKNRPYQQRRERDKKIHQKKYNTRKEAELCPKCGKKTIDNKVYCYYCRKKHSYKYNNKRVYNELNHICGLCGKNKRTEGKRVCEECYKDCLKRINKMNLLRSE